MLPTVRKNDGFQRTTPALRPVIERLQRALRRAGFTVSTDGLFGQGTHDAVVSFQLERELEADGIVGPATWRAVEPYLRPSERMLNFAAISSNEASGMNSFRGDLGWIHDREGHAGKPYWPGGESGVTLDPGFDLAHQSRSRLFSLYGGFLSRTELDRLAQTIGLKGLAAKDALSGSEELRRIRISRDEALAVMPEVAVTYWVGIITRFAVLAEPETPPSVQTALLSLAYNRGVQNRELGLLADPLVEGNWLEVADLIGKMQQDHSLAGIRRRRKLEAGLIEDELDFLRQPQLVEATG